MEHRAEAAEIFVKFYKQGIERNILPVMKSRKRDEMVGNVCEITKFQRFCDVDKLNSDGAISFERGRFRSISLIYQLREISLRETPRLTSPVTKRDNT